MTSSYTAPNGAPTWIDVMTSDVAATQAFYPELLGWTVVDPGRASLPRFGYQMASVRSSRVREGSLIVVSMTRLHLRRVLYGSMIYGQSLPLFFSIQSSCVLNEDLCQGCGAWSG